MKKKIVLLLAVILACTMALTIFVACNKDKKPEATLTLELNGNGTLETTEYQLQVGQNVSSFMADKIPTANEGLQFVGWYEGDTPLSPDRTMPEEGLTLTARFNGTFTIKIHYYTFDNSSGNYIYDSPVEFTQTGQSGTSYVLPKNGRVTVPEKFRFGGFATSSDSQFAEYAGGSTIGLDNIDLYEKWDSAYTDVFEGEDLLYAPAAEPGVAYLIRQSLPEKKGVINALSGVFSFAEGDNTILEGKLLTTQTQNKFFYFKTLVGTVATQEDLPDNSLTFGEGDRVTLKTPDGESEGSFTVDPVTGEYLFTPDGEMSPSVRFSLGYVSAQNKFVYYVASGTERGFYQYTSGHGVFNDNIIYLDGMYDSQGLAGLRSYQYEDGQLRFAFQGYYYQENTGYSVSYALQIGETLVGHFLIDKQQPVSPVGDVTFEGTFTTSDGFEGIYLNLSETNPSVTNDDLILDGFGKGTFKGQAGTYAIQSFGPVTMFSTASGNYTWEDEWIAFTPAQQTASAPILIRPAVNIYGPNYSVMQVAPGLMEWAHSATRMYGTRFGQLAQEAAFYRYSDNNVYVFTHYYDVELETIVYEEIDYGSIQEVEDHEGIYRYVSTLLSYNDDNDDPVYWGYYFKYDNEHKIVASEAIDGVSYGNNIKVTLDGALEYKSGSETKSVPLGEYEIEVTYDLSESFEIYTFYELRSVSALNDTRDYVASVLHTIEEDESRAKWVDLEKPLEIVYRMYPGQDSNFLTLLQYDLNGKKAAAIGGMQSESGEELLIIHGTLSQDSDALHFAYDDSMDEAVLDILLETDIEYTLFASGCDLKRGTLNGREVYYYFDSYSQYKEHRFTNDNGDVFEIDGYGKARLTISGQDAVEGDYERICDAGKDSVDSIYSFTAGGETKYIAVHETVETEVYTYDFEVLTSDSDNEVGLHYFFDINNMSYFANDFIVFMGNGKFADISGGADGAEFGTYENLGERDFDIGTLIFGFPGGDAMSWTEYRLDYDNEDNDIVYLITAYSSELGRNLYILRNEQTQEFTTTDGTKITGDGYELSTFEYLGVTLYGDYIVCNYDDSTIYPDEAWYNMEVDWANGKQVYFVSYYYYEETAGGRGSRVDLQMEFMFDKQDDGRLSRRTESFGSYALYRKGDVTNETIRLDGHHSATIYNAAGEEVDSGEYRRTTDAYQYVSSDLVNGVGTFLFRPATMSDSSNNATNIYYIVGEKYVYVSTDWQVLDLGIFDNESPYYNGTYIDHFGNVTRGYYGYFTDNLVYFETESGDLMYFYVNGNTFEVYTDVYVYDKGVLYAYQGDTATNMKIPDGVKTIARGAFAYMTGISGRLNLNEVERIEDYAFFRITNLSITSIVSEKVTWIGDYAFATESYAGRSISTISYIYLPNCTHIGAYAFMGSNQLNLDGDGYNEQYNFYYNVKLNKIEEIGEFAFAISRFEGYDTLNVIDLTGADLSKLTIADNAFTALTISNFWMEKGLPVRLVVSGEESFDFIKNWSDALISCVDIRGVTETAPIASYYSLSASRYVVFGEPITADGWGMVTSYSYDANAINGGWVKRMTPYYYNEADGTIKMFLATDVLQFEKTAGEIEIGGSAYYKPGEEQTVSLTVGEDDGVEFKFTLSVSVDDDGKPTVTLASATYNGAVAGDLQVNGSLLIFSVTEEGTKYLVTVNMDILVGQKENAEATD